MYNERHPLMILSMTGYASRTLQLNSHLIQLEIRSVNHRFLDLTIKLSEEIKHLESALRAIITGQINRGKVDVKLYIKENKANAPSININHELLQQYLKLGEEIQQLTSKNINISMHDILHFPGIINQDSNYNESFEQQILAEFNLLLIEFIGSQQAEGEKIMQMLLERTSQIDNTILTLRPLVGKATEEYKDKLQKRLAEFLAENEINDTRLQQEFAFFCQKIDVTEEIDRLQAHSSEFTQLVKKGGKIGKRLDFICQEMNREANTFGAKSISIDTSRNSVNLKVLIEQIREQVQNIM